MTNTKTKAEKRVEKIKRKNERAFAKELKDAVKYILRKIKEESKNGKNEFFVYTNGMKNWKNGIKEELKKHGFDIISYNNGFCVIW